MTADSLAWNRLTYTAPYGKCAFCSTYDNEYSADYEIWFETRGGIVVTPNDPPASILFTLCAGCTAIERAEQADPDMPLVMTRSLRRTEKS